ncbi:MAG: hypothetical protein BECKG1743D_GA0114223_110822 [Candidatus Kentron sp. G]|nr:MAG: hypothetical protein BECKG1743D_GA0114223_110822 [Candidatus Kentron sp. G]
MATTSPSVSSVVDFVQAVKHFWNSIESSLAITQAMQSSEGIPFLNSRNLRNQSSFVWPNSAMLFHPSAPLRTADMHSRRISGSG